jgi:hypothetical protein
MGSNGLFTCHMIYVCPCNAETPIFGFEATNTTAVFFDRGEVSCIGGMAQVDGASGRDGVSETLCRVMISRTENNASAYKNSSYCCSRGPHTVEHISSQGHRYNKVFGIPNSHYVARFFHREVVGTYIHPSVDM